ncbi:oxoglutarate iron-dependent oxygenase [Fusarium longipes]|uniref:Oxoglutarate iron-dependent oxygenase n=1 Tax=Fusarium longipes TaxID=694270 RepID=A0A395T3E6_9HYPO|nr:oxoglutarate iron-dependent oxygenase [Fusarium longipes]
MQPPSLSRKSWDSLPSEIRLLIFQSLRQDGSKLACLAAVSRAWQADLERYNFTRIKLTPSRLVDFRSMIRRNQALVRYIWFSLELDDYDCTHCAPRSVDDTEHCPITASFQGLFSILSEWDKDSKLMLDISIYSPSDAQHWFPYLTFVSDNPFDKPEGSGIEPTTYIYGLEYLSLFESIRHGHYHLKKLVSFENFNQQYPVFMQQFLFGEDLRGCDSIRIPTPAVGRTIAQTSLPLEHLAASFIIEASHFFAIDPSWGWLNLTSLVLTSRLLTPEENSTKIDALLQAAAVAALRMPRLETMEIWNGQKGLAALFQYRVIRGLKQTRILWRGTWKYHISPSVLQAWEAVGHLHDSWRLDVVQEQVEESAIQSHGDALHHLMLSGQAIRSVSLQQIRREQKSLEGVEILP